MLFYPTRTVCYHQHKGVEREQVAQVRDLVAAAGGGGVGGGGEGEAVQRHQPVLNPHVGRVLRQGKAGEEGRVTNRVRRRTGCPPSAPYADGQSR